jgi:hypothetical protein
MHTWHTHLLRHAVLGQHFVEAVQKVDKPLLIVLLQIQLSEDVLAHVSTHLQGLIDLFVNVL